VLAATPEGHEARADRKTSSRPSRSTCLVGRDDGHINRVAEHQEVARCNSETSTLRDAENGALEGEPLVVPLAIPLIAVFSIPR